LACDESYSNDNVILLHGMGRTSASMNKIANVLAKSGYRVVNIGYPSTKKPPLELVQQYILPELQQLKKHSNSKIHFVTHSLGGILLRLLLQTENLPVGSRIIMLSPPNHGSEIVDKYKHRWWFRFINGPAGQVLGTEQSSLPNSLAAITPSVGIITGNKSYEPWFSRLMHNDDDGKVSVTSARLTEMTDFLVVNLSHTLIMHNLQVIEQIHYFLINERFNHMNCKL